MQLDADALEIIRVVQSERREPIYGKSDRMYIARSDALESVVFCKEIDLRPGDADAYYARISAAACSPYATPIVGWLNRNGERVGWAEPYIRHLRPFAYREREGDVFSAHCLHQMALLQFCFLDTDPATINWAKDHCGRLFTFDKDAVWPLEVARKNFAWPDGEYFELFKQSYGESVVSHSMVRHIAAVISSGESADDIASEFAHQFTMLS